MLLILALLYVPSVHACDKEHRYRHHDRHLERRDTAPVFPPTLTVNEEILASSFDNTSLASWSSYYCKNWFADVLFSSFENAHQVSQHIDGTSQAKAKRFQGGLQNAGMSMASKQD
jgi:hypothetical protein